MMIKNSTDLNQRMRIQSKDINIDLNSLLAMVAAEKANIDMLTPEMKSAYQSQNCYAKLIGKQITMSKERIKKLEKLIWKHQQKQKIVGRMIQQTNSRKYFRDEWNGYCLDFLGKYTFVPNKRIENMIFEKLNKVNK